MVRRPVGSSSPRGCRGAGLWVSGSQNVPWSAQRQTPCLPHSHPALLRSSTRISPALLPPGQSPLLRTVPNIRRSPSGGGPCTALCVRSLPRVRQGRGRLRACEPAAQAGTKGSSLGNRHPQIQVATPDPSHPKVLPFAGTGGGARRLGPLRHIINSPQWEGDPGRPPPRPALSTMSPRRRQD